MEDKKPKRKLWRKHIQEDELQLHTYYNDEKEHEHTYKKKKDKTSKKELEKNEQISKKEKDKTSKRDYDKNEQMSKKDYEKNEQMAKSEHEKNENKSKKKTGKTSQKEHDKNEHPTINEEDASKDNKQKLKREKQERIKSDEVDVKERKKEKKIKNKYKNDKLVFSVAIHCMDRTEGLPILLSMPVVEVFVCNIDEGTLLKKSSKKRKVTSFYEADDINEILPLMTSPFNVRERRSLFCQWEEELIFNESLTYLKDNEDQVILLFHLKDFGTVENKDKPSKSSNSASLPSSKKPPSWKTFAWAFLKLIALTGQENIENRIQLQLFKPRKLYNVKFIDLFSWWKSGNRRKYKSSLHVTLRGITLPENPNPTLRSMLPNQGEGGKYISSSQLELGADTESPKDEVKKIEWTKKPNEPCQIPNTITYRCSSLGEGCMVVKFSNDGLKIGCGTNQYVLIYSAVNGQLLYCLRGHLGLVYDLDWSLDDKYLLSCSADATARVWKFKETSINEYFMEALVHPSYVYTVKFKPSDRKIIISGCYDHILRVWVKHTGKYSITQELNLHLGYITSLIYDKEEEYVYSSDSQGLLGCWKINKNFIVGPKKHRINYLEIEDTLKINNIYGTPINSLVLHPSGKSILIHSKDSCIRLFSLRSRVTIQKYHGHLNMKEMIKSSISPCGSWVLSGSEDSSMYVWDSESGEMHSAIFDLPFDKTISCIDFHPFDNIVAVSSYTMESNIILMKYDSSKAIVHTIPKEVQPAKPLTQDNVKSLGDLEYTQKEGKWKDVGRDLLLKLDFILKVACDEPSCLQENRPVEWTSKKTKPSTMYDYSD